MLKALQHALGILKAEPGPDRFAGHPDANPQLATLAELHRATQAWDSKQDPDGTGIRRWTHHVLAAVDLKPRDGHLPEAHKFGIRGTDFFDPRGEWNTLTGLMTVHPNILSSIHRLHPGSVHPQNGLFSEDADALETLIHESLHTTQPIRATRGLLGLQTPYGGYGARTVEIANQLKTEHTLSHVFPHEAKQHSPLSYQEEVDGVSGGLTYWLNDSGLMPTIKHEHVRDAMTRAAFALSRDPENYSRRGPLIRSYARHIAHHLGANMDVPAHQRDQRGTLQGRDLETAFDFAHHMLRQPLRYLQDLRSRLESVEPEENHDHGSLWGLPRNDVNAALEWVQLTGKENIRPEDWRVLMKLQDDPTELQHALSRMLS